MPSVSSTVWLTRFAVNVGNWGWVMRVRFHGPISLYTSVTSQKWIHKFRNICLKGCIHLIYIIDKLRLPFQACLSPFCNSWHVQMLLHVLRQGGFVLHNLYSICLSIIPSSNEYILVALPTPLPTFKSLFSVSDLPPKSGWLP